MRTTPQTFEEQIAELRLEMSRGKQQMLDAIATARDVARPNQVDSMHYYPLTHEASGKRS